MDLTPSVCAIMLVNGRPEMVQRAIKSFRSQTYQNKILLLFDTGNPFKGDTEGANHVMFGSIDWTVGRLRNEANSICSSDVIAHLDSDDVSHPRRIEEQVALLQSAKKCCVGYSDLLFWETCGKCDAGYSNTLPRCPYCGLEYDPSRKVPVGKAWLWTAGKLLKPAGTSLCYWRAAWQARPFGDHPKKKGATGEEQSFLQGLDFLGVSSIPVHNSKFQELEPFPPSITGYIGTGRIAEPRMIASIHGGNTQYYNPPESAELSNGTSWRRAEQWDEHCRIQMQL